MASNSEEISLKELGKKVVKTSAKNRKKITLLLVGIMVLCGAYFTKVMIQPKYKSELVLKSRYVRKDALSAILEKYNFELKEEKPNLSKQILDFFRLSRIIKLELSEIKPDITSPEKNDPTKYYKLIAIHHSKPLSSEMVAIDSIISDIKRNASIDNDVKIGRATATMAIAELDSLLKVAIPAGNSFKNKLETSGGMILMNDLYKNLNELLTRKSALTSELNYYQTENLIFKISPIVTIKAISYPIVIFLIGFIVWFILCSIYIGGIVIFGSDED